MLYDLIQCEYSLPVEIGFLNIDPVLNTFFGDLPQGLEGRCPFQPRVHPYSEIISTSFKDVVMGNGLKVAAFLPAQLWLLRQPEPEGKPCSWIVQFQL